MRSPVEIENIEEMRLQEGIDDVELREAIGQLRPGDLVRLTLSAGPASARETLTVRITSIKGRAFRGKLVNTPSTPGLSKLRAGSPLTFTTAHIHSLPKGQPSQER